MNNISKITIAKNVTFTNIRDDRFKTAKLTVNMLLPLKIDTVSSNAILPFVLRRSCEKYKSFTQLNKKLASLYGASLYADARKLGEMQVLSLSALFVDDRYVLDSEGFSLEIADLICDMIFNPNVKDGKFNEADFDQEKRQLIETIESDYNDKRLYAKQRCEELMCNNEAYGINPFGNKAQAEALKNNDVYEAWIRVLKNARFEIMLIGNVKYENICECFKKRFKNINREPELKCSTLIVRSANGIHEYSEKIDVSQAKLVMGFRTDSAIPDSTVMATRLMSALFGETPQSKLFLNVREKLSLCYYCSSSYYKEKGIMYVQSGVDECNIEKAKDEILKQLENICKGDFDEEELNSIKLSLSNSWISISDYLTGLENWYFMQIFEDKIKSPREKVNEILAVDRQAVIDAAKKVTLDTIYKLY